MNTKQYKFLDDGSHGWLAVPLTDLEDLGIEDQISECSYVDHDWGIAYLEEDCDATTFITAKLEHATPGRYIGVDEFVAWFAANASTSGKSESPRHFPHYVNPHYVSPFSATISHAI